jgi:hypothetical protein
VYFDSLWSFSYDTTEENLKQCFRKFWMVNSYFVSVGLRFISDPATPRFTTLDL